MSLKTKLEDHIEKGTFVKALGVIGGLAVAFVLVAGSLPAKGGPETPGDRGARQAARLPGFEPTVLPRREPPYAVEAPDGPMTLGEIRGELIAVQFWPDGCAPACEANGRSLGALADRHRSMRSAIVVLDAYSPRQSARVEAARGTPGLLVLADRGDNFGRYVDTTAGPVTVFFAGEGQEIGRIAGLPDWDSADDFVLGLLDAR